MQKMIARIQELNIHSTQSISIEQKPINRLKNIDIRKMTQIRAIIAVIVSIEISPFV